MAQSQLASRTVICDGCGIGSTPEHIARRLVRLEQTTRYRPIHIQAVFLCAESPTQEEEFLYSGGGAFQGEAAQLLDALGIARQGRDRDAVLSEFQRRGYMLTHVLECSSGKAGDSDQLTASLKAKLPSVLRRLRTSLKPKKVFVISQAMAPICQELVGAQLGSELVLDGTSPFDLLDVQSVNRIRPRL